MKVLDATGEDTPCNRRVIKKAPKSGRSRFSRQWHPIIALGAVLLLALSVSQLSVGASVSRTPTQLTSATGTNEQVNAQIALDSSGYSHVTWQGYHPTDGGAPQIWYADNTSGDWPAPAQLTSAAVGNYQSDPQIAVDSSGNSHITWCGKPPMTGGALQIWYADKTSGAWSAPAQLTSATGTNHQGSVQIAVDSSGNSHITWMGLHPTTGGIEQVWYADNTSGAWSAPTQLTFATGSNYQEGPLQIAV